MAQIIARLLSDVAFYVCVLILFVMMRDFVSDGAALLLTGVLLEVYVFMIWLHLSD